MNNSLNSSPFWQTKSLEEMSAEEWESLCDRCGKCCLHKLEDEDTGDVYYTSVACKLLDTKSCQCTDYPNRKQIVPDCTVLTIKDIRHFHWLPDTCAYRLISENKPLYDWHPLISGSGKSIHTAGISVKGWALSENDIGDDDLEDFIIPHQMV
ncbi:YcgN family cysteine cluster protein [uncultured Endozoicomonas sp.]|uniref:YcgN family cysteine cluster protein n=1 Tax=uncultured Endozoicomonas sp. TaxID=432652 RepID=UPI0026078B74|nr:YcgN family cysteine cluster protein [uncultured Endozoicomonas sp.]